MTLLDRFQEHYTLDYGPKSSAAAIDPKTPDSEPGVLAPVQELLQAFQRRAVSHAPAERRAGVERRRTSSPLRTSKALLDQAKLAKVLGDGRADSNVRTADYRSAAAILRKMVQLANDSGSGLFPSDAYDITKWATNAAALLSQTGLD